jgi:hypothetical protein
MRDRAATHGVERPRHHDTRQAKDIMESAPRSYVLECYPAFPEAARLADLSGIRDDLESVLSHCSELEKQIDKNWREFVVWDALASHAVILYARCFASGLRERLQHELMDKAPPDLASAHDFFINLRNKHIAHSVNAFEENVAVVCVRMDGREPQQVESVRIQSRRFMAVEAAQVRLLRALAEWLRKQVEQAYEDEYRRVLALAAALPLHDIVAHRSEPLPAFFDPQSISRPRIK